MASFLMARRGLDEINFWRPSPKNAFAALKPGEPFLFKTHHPGNELVGGAFFETFARLRVSEAWAWFGHGNGVDSAVALRDATARYRTPNDSTRDDPTIGCVILSDVFWFDDRRLPGPDSFAKNVVQGRGYDVGEDSVVDLALAELLASDAARTAVESDSETVTVLGPTKGSPRTVVPRLGQGAFRAVVLDAYEARCAITGHKIRPTLQAAHIRPVASGGQHRVDNGLLLRSDIHTLFDLGYVSIGPQSRLLVSPRLRNDFGNGDDLYAMASEARSIAIPKRVSHRPSAEALEWHRDAVFLA